MAKVTIKFHETTRAQRQKMLRDACQASNANESLELLIEKMRGLEAQYGMSTIEFYARFTAGKMGDCRDFIRWAGAFQAYQDLLRQINSETEAKVA